MVDPECFDADPDPTFHADADQKLFNWEGQFFSSFKIMNYSFQNLTKPFMCNLFSNNAGGRVRGEG